MTKTLIIYGPTVTGKTSLAINLAKKYNGEIISADSRQVYRGLDIGTGKLSLQQLSDSKIKRFKGYWIVDGVKIHGFDLKNPEEQFSAADFIKFAHTTMIQIIGVNKLPIVVGGTGFYIKALIDGIESLGIQKNQKLRQQLEKLSISELYKKLQTLAPERAKSMNQSDRNNPRRLVRAIEIKIASTSSVSSTPEVKSANTSGVRKNQKLNAKRYPLNALLLGLTAPNHYLYERADAWLETRLKHGMIEEIQALLKRKVDPKWLDQLGLEYRWFTRYLTHQIKKEEAIERLKGDIHSFIRRQKTWFKKLPTVKLYDISQSLSQRQLEKTVKACFLRQ